jgi:hypothetical protein
MGSEIAKLYVELGAKTDELVKGVGHAEGAMSRFHHVGTVAAKTVGIALLGMGAEALKAGDDLQQSQAAYQAAIKATHASLSAENAVLDEATKKLQHYGVTEDITTRLVAKLTQAHIPASKQMMVMQAAANLAAAKHLDLNSAMTKVIMAAQGNARVLKEYGIVLPPAEAGLKQLKIANDQLAAAQDNYTKQLKAHGKTSDQTIAAADKLAKAQAKVSDVTKQLKDRWQNLDPTLKGLSIFNGQAEAKSQTLAGAMAELKATFTDMLGTIGLPLAQGFSKFLHDNMGAIKGFASFITDHMDLFEHFAVLFGELFAVKKITDWSRMLGGLAGVPGVAGGGAGKLGISSVANMSVGTMEVGSMIGGKGIGGPGGIIAGGGGKGAKGGSAFGFGTVLLGALVGDQISQMGGGPGIIEAVGKLLGGGAHGKTGVQNNLIGLQGQAQRSFFGWNWGQHGVHNMAANDFFTQTGGGYGAYRQNTPFGALNLPGYQRPTYGPSPAILEAVRNHDWKGLNQTATFLNQMGGVHKSDPVYKEYMGLSQAIKSGRVKTEADLQVWIDRQGYIGKQLHRTGGIFDGIRLHADKAHAAVMDMRDHMLKARDHTAEAQKHLGKLAGHVQPALTPAARLAVGFQLVNTALTALTKKLGMLNASTPSTVEGQKSLPTTGGAAPVSTGAGDPRGGPTTRGFWANVTIHVNGASSPEVTAVKVREALLSYGRRTGRPNLFPAV